MNENDTEFHEKMKLTQAQIAAQFSESNPSEVSEVRWIYAIRAQGNYPAATEQSGKWLVFAPWNEIDEVWKKIKEATSSGKLGGSAKVATNMGSWTAADPENSVICVYTYDWTDDEDMTRIREELRALGITRKIAYKSDEDTLAGKYKATGDRGFSKRYE